MFELFNIVALVLLALPVPFIIVFLVTVLFDDHR